MRSLVSTFFQQEDTGLLVKIRVDSSKNKDFDT